MDFSAFGGAAKFSSKRKHSKICIYFDSVEGENRSRIARLNTDGSLDGNFNPGIYHPAVSSVQVIKVQRNGAILIGGGFTSVGGIARNNIARVNADGSIDTAFDPNADHRVHVITIQKDSKILVGGFFDTVGGDSQAYLARLNLDGSLDTNFSQSLNGSVLSILLQNDSNILVGGDFTSVNTLVQTRIARLSNTAPPQIDIEALSASKAEGDLEFRAFTFMVSRSNFDLIGSTTVNYQVTGGNRSPANEGDFGGVFRQGVVTFAEGESSKRLTIFVSGDVDVESDESFSVSLSNSNNTIIESSKAMGTIIDDDDDSLCITIKAANGNLALVCF